MIRHIVFFSAKNQKSADSIRTGLSKLGEIPHPSKFEVSFNRKSDPLSSAVDIVVYAEFADDAALAAYRAHPVYAETTRIVRPLRELRFSADIEAADAVS